MQQASIVSRGIRLNLDLLTAGPDAPPLLFLHGTGKHARFYLPFLQRLREAGFTVLGLDVQGHGRSQGRRGDFTIPELVQNTQEAISFARDRFGPRLGLIGTSQGAIVALYTLAADDRVTSAMCHNAALLNEPDARAVNVSRFSRLVRPLVPLAAKFAPRMRVPIRRYLRLDTVYDDLALGRRLENDGVVVPSYTLRSFASLATARPARPVEQIRTPVLVLAAERDRLFPTSYVRSIYDRLTCRKEFAVLPKTGHMLFVEYVEQSLPTVIGWFDRTLRNGPA